MRPSHYLKGLRIGSTYEEIYRTDEYPPKDSIQQAESPPETKLDKPEIEYKPLVQSKL
jgi:hypothetical protein